MTSEKTILPTKTKIAAWWMIIFGGINLGVFLFFWVDFFLLLIIEGWGIWTKWIKGYFLGEKYPLYEAGQVYFFTLILLCLLVSISFLAGLFLLWKRKGAWRFAIITLTIPLIFSSKFFFQTLLIIFDSDFYVDTHVFLYYLIPALLFGIISFPFILLLLDRNQWKIIFERNSKHKKE